MSITSFVPKRHFNIRDIGYYKTVNVYKFSKSFSRTHYVPFLEAYSSALGNNEYYYEQVLRVISMLEKPEIKALITKHKWYEIDDVQDYDNAEVLFAPDVESLNLYQKDLVDIMISRGIGLLLFSKSIFPNDR